MTTKLGGSIAAAVLLCNLVACARDAGQTAQSESARDSSEIGDSIVPGFASTGGDAIAPDISINVADGRIALPDTINAGWQRIRVTETGASHIVVFFRLTEESADEGSVQDFLAALDSTANTPASAVAFGGPEIGMIGDVLLDIAPGRYVVACVVRGKDKHRHAVAGEARTVVAVARSGAVSHPSPAPTLHVNMVDFAFTGSESWRSGAQLIRVTNNGVQDHQLRIARLADGVTLQEVMEADDAAALMSGVAGVARIGAGREAMLPVQLVPGNYLLSCLVADPKSLRPHVELGMVRLVRVD